MLRLSLNVFSETGDQERMLSMYMPRDDRQSVEVMCERFGVDSPTALKGRWATIVSPVERQTILGIKPAASSDPAIPVMKRNEAYRLTRRRSN
jgi:hypothetical protein